MSWWQEAIRALFAVPTAGMSELIGRDNQIGRTVTGGAEGGAGGFLTGGPIGAAMGAGTGMGLSGTGTTDPYSWKGGAINAGSGAGAGGLTHLPALFGSSGMSPYMPTSPPNMGAAGSTLGGGMGSPLNYGGGAATAGGGAGGVSATSQALQMMRGMPMGGGQQQPQESALERLSRIYKQFPQLRPHFGGQYGA